MMYRVVVAAIAVASAWGPMATAQSSQLQQSVDPILCVFTSTDSGTAVSGSTVCDSTDAPTISSIDQSLTGRPVLSGKLPTTSFRKCRVWIGSQWFTYGISPQLQVNGNAWELDLSQPSDRLAPGDYTVVVELLTNDDYLFRSVYADAFAVPVVTVTDTITNVSPGIVTRDRQVYHSDQPVNRDQALPLYDQNDKNSDFDTLGLLPKQQIAPVELSTDDVKNENQPVVPALVAAATGIGLVGAVGLVVRRIVMPPRK